MDEWPTGLEPVMAALIGLAGSIDRSWSTRFAEQEAPALDESIFLDLPRAVTIKRCGGYAFYSPYPDLIRNSTSPRPEAFRRGASLSVCAASAPGWRRLRRPLAGPKPASHCDRWVTLSNERSRQGRGFRPSLRARLRTPRLVVDFRRPPGSRAEAFLRRPRPALAGSVRRRLTGAEARFRADALL